MSDEHERPPTQPPPVDFDAFDDDEHGERKRLFERAIPQVVKRVIERAVETGVEKLTEAPENLRELVNEMRLPKEAAHFMYEQMDDTKKGVYRVVAKEIRDVLEHINFADEIAEVLTKLQFEINTTIRFVPNKSPDEEEAGEGEEAEEENRRAPSTHPPVASGPADVRDGERKRPSRIPRPQVVSKVVMKTKEALKPKD
jgi:hypothetical protein